MEFKDYLFLIVTDNYFYANFLMHINRPGTRDEDAVMDPGTSRYQEWGYCNGSWYQWVTGMRMLYIGSWYQ